MAGNQHLIPETGDDGVALEQITLQHRLFLFRLDIDNSYSSIANRQNPEVTIQHPLAHKHKVSAYFESLERFQPVVLEEVYAQPILLVSDKHHTFEQSYLLDGHFCDGLDVLKLELIVLASVARYATIPPAQH